MAKRKFKKVNLTKIQIGQQISTEQQFLQDLFSGNDTWGTGNNLPEINGTLISGGGLINNGDIESETASMFGFKKKNGQEKI